MRVTLSRQILAGYAVAVGALVAVIVVAAMALDRAADAKDEIINHDVRAVVAAWKLRSALDEQAVQHRGFLLTGDEDLLARRAAAAAEFDALLRELRELVSPDRGAALLDSIASAEADWAAATDAVIARRRSGQVDLAALGRTVEQRLVPARREVGLAIDELIAQQEATIAANIQASDGQVAAARWLTIILGVGAAAAAAAIGLWVTRDVRRQVQMHSADIDGATAEILAGTRQQVEGSARQSAAVQQTVATVEELERTSDQSAERARAVADTAQRSAETAQAGRRAVADSFAGMEDIRGQVDQIATSIVELADRAQAVSDIVATVEDIADQTHLLALNASIEAARAGEHGKGFAVVAGEVRTLADQSKQATTQVGEIIAEIQRAMNAAVMVTEQGTKSVTEGVELIAGAGRTIEDLAETVASATLAAEQIAASAGQQAVATTQISQAMHDVRDATEQGLASSRQVEERARDLDVVARALRALVGNHQP
ncbi:MAG TPA: methyl-accepting chemotaxis protein [Nitriliruptorales bacterium]|nr:methyl-accepting chemotaxis protein [Nitriliruptorales bacterium]